MTGIGKTKMAMALRSDDERGSVTLEVAVLTPAMLLFCGLVVVAGRLAQAHQVVEAAAGEAARAATAAQDVRTAGARSAAAAAAAMSSAGLPCQSTAASVDTSQWALPPGQPARVTVKVSCTVRLGDLSLPGLPGSKTVSATAGSALDTYRAR
ncbi:MAG: TadE/TadG family type IV pilus assembly protein [Candidatus Nanopelagicales bacterium]